MTTSLRTLSLALAVVAGSFGIANAQSSSARLNEPTFTVPTAVSPAVLNDLRNVATRVHEVSFRQNGVKKSRFFGVRDDGAGSYRIVEMAVLGGAPLSEDPAEWNPTVASPANAQLVWLLSKAGYTLETDPRLTAPEVKASAVNHIQGPNGVLYSYNPPLHSNPSLVQGRVEVGPNAEIFVGTKVSSVGRLGVTEIPIASENTAQIDKYLRIRAEAHYESPFDEAKRLGLPSRVDRVSADKGTLRMINERNLYSAH